MEDDSLSSREHIVPTSNSTSLASFLSFFFLNKKIRTCGTHTHVTVPGIEMGESVCVPQPTMVVTSPGPAKLWE